MSAFALMGFAASGFVAARFGYRITLILPGLGYALSALLAAAFIRAADLTPQRVARD
ncbi:hypothetical protein IVA79_10185 [Bradyrhizobium sp. 138]|uniref:hypothetical protein n=1 Tax=Bradyrhizobium sp. 138 TaxID=2782615 RepID=UPI001FFA25ED|nr:hypothetical protein [Bradyrhizobium sp. 138]MCK1734315.1 hypothetical protein [Bradyrhizobium sp. 138]